MKIPDLHRANIHKNLYLRAITKHDVSNSYVDWLSDTEVTRFTEIRHHNQTKEMIEDFVESKLSSRDEWLAGMFVGSHHVGNIKLGPVRDVHKSAEISFFVGDKRYWGCGIASSSIKLIVDFAFKTLMLDKVTASCYAPNIGSARALIKAGFIEEAVIPKAVIFQGQRLDVQHFGCYRDDIVKSN